MKKLVIRNFEEKHLCHLKTHMSVSILQIFQHLHVTCSNITDLDLQQNEDMIRQPWNQE